MPRKHRKMKGGFLESLTGDISSGWNSLSQSATNAYNKSKQFITSASPTTTSFSPQSGLTTGGRKKRTKRYRGGDSENLAPYDDSQTPYKNSMTSPTTGGRRKRTKRYRGGFNDNTPITGLASTAAPISGINSAQPHNWVGGKTKKRSHRQKHRRSKSCKHH
jgi:hypothetical protein